MSLQDNGISEFQGNLPTLQEIHSDDMQGSSQNMHNMDVFHEGTHSHEYQEGVETLVNR